MAHSILFSLARALRALSYALVHIALVPTRPRPHVLVHLAYIKRSYRAAPVYVYGAFHCRFRHGVSTRTTDPHSPTVYPFYHIRYASGHLTPALDDTINGMEQRVAYLPLRICVGVFDFASHSYVLFLFFFFYSLSTSQST